MGLTHVRMSVRPVEGETRKEELEFLVDSGALYTVIPRGVWQRLGIAPKDTVAVSLADGTLLSRQVGFAYLSYADAEAPCKVILGELGDEALMGATALESLGYVLDPLQRRIKPAHIRM